MDQLCWVREAALSVRPISRTSAGIDNTSRSYDKPPLSLQSGPELARKTEENLEAALTFAWESRHAAFTAESMRSFLDQVADRVNDGLVPFGRPRYRTWKTKYSGPVDPEGIEGAYAGFALWLAASLDGSDQVALAARAERELNFRIHPFADGCGRATRVVGAWILLRAGRAPALFPDADTYYRLMRLSEDAWVAEYRQRT